MPRKKDSGKSVVLTEDEYSALETYANRIGVTVGILLAKFTSVLAYVDALENKLGITRSCGGLKPGEISD